jgi:hypothetical protein
MQNDQIPPPQLRSQRWRQRREHFVPGGSCIDPREYAVDVIGFSAAKPFILENHYSGSAPATRLSVGLFRNGPGGTSRLVGVALFSVPIQNASVLKHTGLANPRAAVDLGRFCLLDEVAANGETFFLSRALRLCRRVKPEIEAVISYSDPMPRRDESGRIWKRGHLGGIHIALGGSSAHFLSYRGRSSRRLEYLTRDGQTFSPRAVSKIRNGESGQAYAIDELRRRGAPSLANGATPREWFDGLVASGFFIRRPHPGSHTYSYALTRGAKRAARPIPSLPFPAFDLACRSDDQTALPLFAAAAKEQGEGEGVCGG